MPSIMTLPVTRRPAPGAVSTTTSTTAALRGWWQGLQAAWHRWGEVHDIDTLDAALLRDIGLSRSELSSYRAEVAGEVEATRVRAILQRQAGD